MLRDRRANALLATTQKLKCDCPAQSNLYNLNQVKYVMIKINNRTDMRDARFDAVAEFCMIQKTLKRDNSVEAK